MYYKLDVWGAGAVVSIDFVVGWLPCQWRSCNFCCWLTKAVVNEVSGTRGTAKLPISEGFLTTFWTHHEEKPVGECLILYCSLRDHKTHFESCISVGHTPVSLMNSIRLGVGISLEIWHLIRFNSKSWSTQCWWALVYTHSWSKLVFKNRSNITSNFGNIHTTVMLSCVRFCHLKIIVWVSFVVKIYCSIM